MPHLMPLLRRLHGPISASLMACLAASLISGCVAYPYPYTYAEPVPVPARPSRFDRAWDAALGAAADAGVQVGVADRASGQINGVKAGAAVSIRLQTLADGSVQVAFDAPNSRETSPTLNERWLAAYNRRMGR
jgi:hypothetical protein